jgi:hypothetical protein
MSKERVETIFIIHGRIRRRRKLIREESDSNPLSTEIVLMKINNIILLRMNLSGKNPWEKWKDHRSNVQDPKKITCASISLTKRSR